MSLSMQEQPPCIEQLFTFDHSDFLGSPEKAGGHQQLGGNGGNLCGSPSSSPDRKQSVSSRCSFSSDAASYGSSASPAGSSMIKVGNYQGLLPTYVDVAAAASDPGAAATYLELQSPPPEHDGLPLSPADEAGGYFDVTSYSELQSLLDGEENNTAVITLPRPLQQQQQPLDINQQQQISPSSMLTPVATPDGNEPNNRLEWTYLKPVAQPDNNAVVMASVAEETATDLTAKTLTDLTMAQVHPHPQHHQHHIHHNDEGINLHLLNAAPLSWPPHHEEPQPPLHFQVKQEEGTAMHGGGGLLVPLDPYAGVPPPYSVPVQLAKREDEQPHLLRYEDLSVRRKNPSTSSSSEGRHSPRRSYSRRQMSRGDSISSRGDDGEVRLCHVCSEKAGKHSYYGGQVCPSCRAFFRRSVQSK